MNAANTAGQSRGQNCGQIKLGKVTMTLAHKVHTNATDADATLCTQEGDCEDRQIYLPTGLHAEGSNAQFPVDHVHGLHQAPSNPCT